MSALLLDWLSSNTLPLPLPQMLLDKDNISKFLHRLVSEFATPLAEINQIDHLVLFTSCNPDLIPLTPLREPRTFRKQKHVLVAFYKLDGFVLEILSPAAAPDHQQQHSSSLYDHPISTLLGSDHAIQLWGITFASTDILATHSFFKEQQGTIVTQVGTLRPSLQDQKRLIFTLKLSTTPLQLAFITKQTKRNTPPSLPLSKM